MVLTRLQNIITSAQRLISASTSGIPCPPIRAFIGESDIDAAYEVQRRVAAHRIGTTGVDRIGVKIGLTSPKVQAQLGVDQPDYGTLYSDMQVAEGQWISMDSLMQPKIETEIAFILSHDINGQISDPAELISSIAYACASLEIVGSRIENWNIRITDTIADNASASHFVLGHVRRDPAEIDLEGCRMRMLKNGEEVSVGTGRDCMGSPLLALQWLANVMHEHGAPLRKDEIILTGALGPMVVIATGDHIEAEIEGLGRVDVRVS